VELVMHKETEKIFNIFQADFLIKNGCNIIGTGLQGKVYVEFVKNQRFDKYMEVWRNRKH